MTADLREKCHFGAFHIFAYFSPKSANMHISRVLRSTGGDFHHFKRLSRKSKNLKIFMTADLREKCHFWAFHIFAYFSPKSANMHISRSCGQLVAFSSFLKAFQKVKKFKDFHDSGPATNCHFAAFHILAYFSPKSANIHISRVLWSTGGDFHHFKRLSRKSKNLKICMTADLREKCRFWAFHIFAYFSPKSANMHISRVLLSTGGGFHHF